VSVSDHQYIMLGQSTTSTTTTSPRQSVPESRHSHAISTIMSQM
jgi:hypothetical protein